MLDHHTTRDGLTILIAEMDDTHLINTIKLFSKDLPALAEHAQGDNMVERDVLYKRPGHIKPDDATRLWRNQIQRLYPYLAEAILRDSIRDDVASIAKVAIGRSTGIEQTIRLGQNLCLSSGFIDEDDSPF